ncbi:MAG TPA: secretin N-terminal domain-containing protein [Pyrinomonadaceae bacterium]
MFIATKNIIFTLTLLLTFVCGSFAQQATSQPAPKADDNYVTEKGFKSKVFDVKYRDAESLGRVLRQLGSGFKGAAVSANSEFKTITVRDFPENIVTMEEALKRLDVPGNARPNIELHMYVLLASNANAADTPQTGEVPAELKAVLAQLRETLNYRNYGLATSIVQRLTETQRGLRGKGIADISRAPNSAENVQLLYEYFINSVTAITGPAGTPSLQIGEFTFSTGWSVAASKAGVDDRTQIQTTLNLRDGEKVVVGTATLGDRALIVVLAAKFIN